MSDAPNPATLHQAYQGFPQINSPMVDTATGYITQPWQRLFIRLWQMAGGSFSTIQGSAFTRISPDGTMATLVDVASGKDISTIGLPAPSVGAAALAGLELALVPETAPEAARQVVIFPAPAEPQADFSTQVIMTPPAAPGPDPLLVLALNPLAGLA